MRTTEPAAYGSHGYSRESAEPFAIRTLRETFLSYPPGEQERIRQDVRQKLADERRTAEFRAQPSALARMAGPVYGVRLEDLR